MSNSDIKRIYYRSNFSNTGIAVVYTFAAARRNGVFSLLYKGRGVGGGQEEQQEQQERTSTKNKKERVHKDMRLDRSGAAPACMLSSVLRYGYIILWQRAERGYSIYHILYLVYIYI